MTPVQAKVLNSLLAGQSIAAAARLHGVHRSTIHNWCRREADFFRVLQHSRAQLQERLFDDLQDLAQSSLQALRQVIEDTQTPAGVRTRAALAVLHALKLDQPPAAIPNEIALTQIEQSLAAHREPNEPKASPQPAPSETNPASPVTTFRHPTPPQGRNEPCRCGSGKKHKHCCLTHQQAA